MKPPTEKVKVKIHVREDDATAEDILSDGANQKVKPFDNPEDPELAAFLNGAIFVGDIYFRSKSPG